MNYLQKVKGEEKKSLIINIIKISLIMFVSFSLLGNFVPFFQAYDDISYGLSAILLANGSYGFSNQLLEETENSAFMPLEWVKTQYNTAIPKSSFGIHGIASAFYYLVGIGGLFYLGPIFTILLIIFSERIATKLFGSFVGLVTLILLVSDWRIFEVGLRLVTDNIFSVFFILGCFYLLKFLKKRNYIFILLCSMFFTVSTFIRINGIIFFPIEILILAGYFLFQSYRETRDELNSNNFKPFRTMNLLTRKISSKITTKNFLKFNVLLFIPWLIFAAFWLSYNDYYFGDPTTNYRVEKRTIQIPIYSEEGSDIGFEEKIIGLQGKNPILSFLKFDLDRFEWIQFYSVAALPDALKFGLIVTTSSDWKEDWQAENWMSIFSFFIIILSVFISFYKKIKRTEVLAFTIFILGFWLFFSSDYIAPSAVSAPSYDIKDRYVIPTTLLSFMLFGFILDNIWKSNLWKSSQNNSREIVKGLKGLFLVTVILFFSLTFFIMPPVQGVLQNGFKFNDPAEYSDSFYDFEKLPEDSIIVGDIGRRTLLYTDTHYYPYQGYNVKSEWNPEKLSPDSFQTIQKVLTDDYRAFVFREDMWPLDEKFFKYLEENQGIILIKYSEKFCEIKMISALGDNAIDLKSDPTCFDDIRSLRDKLWNVRLSWPPKFN